MTKAVLLHRRGALRVALRIWTRVVTDQLRQRFQWPREDVALRLFAAARLTQKLGILFVRMAFINWRVAAWRALECLSVQFCAFQRWRTVVGFYGESHVAYEG